MYLHLIRAALHSCLPDVPVAAELGVAKHVRSGQALALSQAVGCSQDGHIQVAWLLNVSNHWVRTVQRLLGGRVAT